MKNVDSRKTVIYVRENSKFAPTVEVSVLEQEKKCKEYINRFMQKELKNLQVIKEEEIETVERNRIQLEKMIAEIKSQKIKIVIVERLNRLGNYEKGIIALFEFLKKNDVRLISLDESIDTKSEQWKEILKMMCLIGEVNLNADD